MYSIHPAHFFYVLTLPVTIGAPLQNLLAPAHRLQRPTFCTVKKLSEKSYTILSFKPLNF